MKITKRGEYALRALMALALVYEQKTLSLREISVKEGLPVKFLEQIMTVLKRAGFVQSLKGKHGGYSLSRSPKEITLGQVIRAVDGPLAPIGTASGIRKQIEKRDRHVGLYVTFLEVRDAIAEILDRTTLADIYEKSLELAHSDPLHQMYYI